MAEEFFVNVDHRTKCYWCMSIRRVNNTLMNGDNICEDCYLERHPEEEEPKCETCGQSLP